MFNAKTLAAVLLLTVAAVAASPAQTPTETATLEGNFNDFLHYTLIGRLDVAKAYAQALLQSNPDPVKLLQLTQQNPRAYQVLERARQNKHDAELAQLAEKLFNTIEQGRFLRRSDAKVIYQEVKRLSEGNRPWFMAVKRLKNSGEYAIPYMLDALADADRKEEWPHVIKALPEIARPAIRPLVAALQTENVQVKIEIIKALGKIKYPQSLPYLKYVIEDDTSPQLKDHAQTSIRQINPAALNVSAAELFYKLAEDYYYHAQSLASAEDADFANIWFWNAQDRRLTRERVDKDYFNELMSMRVCEWTVKADPEFARAIGLWLAAYLKAESSGVAMPNYFGPGHADAITYATTAGPQYLHQALARAVKDKNAYVALGAIEALAVIAGEKSLFYRLGTAQPLIDALSFDDRAVKYSAAIALAAAGPGRMFPQRSLVTDNLAEALTQAVNPTAEESAGWNRRLARSYALRAVSVMLELARTRNPVIDLTGAKNALMQATRTNQPDIQVLAGQVLAHLDSPDAQRCVAAMALDQNNPIGVRIAAFDSLAVSAKLHASLLDSGAIDEIYALVGSQKADPNLRSAAAAAYGALNLPSQRVKQLILDQAKS